MYEVSSEIYSETDFQPVSSSLSAGKVVSKFRFRLPTDEEAHDEVAAAAPKVDKDGDQLVVRRKHTSCIEIEHSQATVLQLVGLQVWRGALLLADFVFHKRQEFAQKQLLELGAGVGLTSIAAAIYAKHVVCTDVDIGGILQLIDNNVQRNRSLCGHRVQVLECDFKRRPAEFAPALQQALLESEIVLAADVVYDDELTAAFADVIDYIFALEQSGTNRKQVYVALEKRYVFTLAELDTVAPMFEHFLRLARQRTWRLEYVPIDFEQYFEYERCKELVLLKLTSCK